MSDAKEIFLRDKELSGKWSGWVHGPDADKVFAFADAVMMNTGGVEMEQIRGAKIYKMILMTLADIDDSQASIPTSGLNHAIDPPSRSKKIQVGKSKV